MTEQQTSLSSHEEILKSLHEASKMMKECCAELTKSNAEVKKHDNELKQRNAEMKNRNSEMNARNAEFKKFCDDMKKTNGETMQLSSEMKKFYAELRKMFSETEKPMKEIEERISTLCSRFGSIIEHVIGDRGAIVNKFRLQGYEITQSSRNVVFDNKNLGLSGEVDILLEGNNVVILIEIKTHLETGDINKQIERIEKYKRYALARGDKRTLYGAVAGAIQEEKVVNYAHSKGLYVIHQFGETDEKLLIPKDFKPKEW